jgi:hypothetical protein
MRQFLTVEENKELLKVFFGLVGIFLGWIIFEIHSPYPKRR